MTAGSKMELGELARRIADELADAADVCRRAEDLAASLAVGGGAELERLAPLQALDELTQRLCSLAAVLEAISDQSPPSWTLSLQPLLAEVRLSALADRLTGLPPAEAVTGDADFF